MRRTCTLLGHEERAGLAVSCKSVDASVQRWIRRDLRLWGQRTLRISAPLRWQARAASARDSCAAQPWLDGLREQPVLCAQHALATLPARLIFEHAYARACRRRGPAVDGRASARRLQLRTRQWMSGRPAPRRTLHASAAPAVHPSSTPPPQPQHPPPRPHPAAAPPAPQLPWTSRTTRLGWGRPSAATSTGSCQSPRTAPSRAARRAPSSRYGVSPYGTLALWLLHSWPVASHRHHAGIIVHASCAVMGANRARYKNWM